jgi:hypothetical protein
VKAAVAGSRIPILALVASYSTTQSCRASSFQVSAVLNCSPPLRALIDETGLPVIMSTETSRRSSMNMYASS